MMPIVMVTPVSAASARMRAAGLLALLGIGRQHVLAATFEDAGAEVAHDAHQPAELVPRREARRDRTVVGRLVVLAARGREADRAGAQRGVELTLHEREVVVGRLLLEGALPHGPRAQGRVADVGRVVDGLRQAVDGLQVLRERLPAPLDADASAAGSMSSARSRLRTTSARASSRTGARVKPQLPMTAVVTPCQHEFAPCGSQKTWASRWVWPSMKPGVTTWPSASSSRSPRSRIRPTRAIVAVDDPDVGPVGAEAGAVDDQTVADHHVVRHASIVTEELMSAHYSTAPQVPAGRGRA